MFRNEIATPCPAPLDTERNIASRFESKQKQSIFNDTYDQFNDDTTQNIAKLVQQEFRNAPPRRTHGLAQKPRRNFPFSIFEDGGSQRQPPGCIETTRTMKSSAINARPAQKIRLQSSRQDRLQVSSTSTHDSPKRNSNDDIRSDDQAKEDRRRTIWVPSDDTTVLSIHPGAYDHTLQDMTIGLPADDIRPTRETPRQTTLGSSAMRQVQRMTSAAPKRTALNALAPSQPNIARNVLGSGGGKENIPPGTLLSRNGKGGMSEVKPLKKVMSQSQSFAQHTAAIQPKAENIRKRSAAEPKDAPRAKVQARTLAGRTDVCTDMLQSKKRTTPTVRDWKCDKKIAISKDVHKPSGASLARQSTVPKHISLPGASSVSSASRYPILSDDLQNPELYEDSWLQHQEVALTQLVNAVFQQAGQSSTIDDENAVRNRMLAIYHDPSTTTIHKRVKASLMYGALSMPKDAPNLPKLREDLGLRRQFVHLFVDNYNLDALQAAVETVTGRVMTFRLEVTEAVHSGERERGDLARTKEMKRFLSTFLIRHEDSTELVNAHKDNIDENPALQAGTPQWFWQRTVLRSLMLIYLLDRAKMSGDFQGCLFLPSSTHKTSASVLQAFARLFVPSVGDISRPLGHLNYSLAHAQEALDEYTYRIDNLAVDLRNGVLLTRFVELLLYPPSTLDTQSDRTVTLDLPAGETLTSLLDSNTDNRVLSQHLKFPCISRVQKSHNVQIALSALAGIRGLTGPAVETIKAEDIVNGHREKTLSLLWAVVSKWGLGFLIDWNELKKETRHFSEVGSQPTDKPNTATSNEQPGTSEQDLLLKAWAASVCQHRNIVITNLTTCFADGRALAAIVSTYADFVPAAPPQAMSKHSAKVSTADRLRHLGCSESFINLFVSQASIPSRSSTISLLAFLASRLLPLARAHRAACTIQRAFRLRLTRHVISLRVRKMRAAADCALVALSKQKEIEAAVVLQRAWRAVLDRRIEKLEGDVRAFQTLARGWAVRRATQGALGGVAGGRRVMGGW